MARSKYMGFSSGTIYGLKALELDVFQDERKEGESTLTFSSTGRVPIGQDIVIAELLWVTKRLMKRVEILDEALVAVSADLDKVDMKKLQKKFSRDRRFDFLF